MFDSIKLYMPQERAGTTDILAQTPVYLDELKPHDKGSLIHYSGYLKNLFVYVSERGAFIKGSLAKYHLGDNIQNFTRSDTEQAINSLSEELHLPIQKADVQSIDFAHNFIMDHKPKVYFNYLGESQHFDRLIQPETLYYQNNSRSKLFYDKLLESKSKHVEIPERLKDQNLLRFEIRYPKRLCDRLNEPEITAKRLYEEHLYIKLVDRYIAEYQSIHKNTKHRELEKYFNTDLMDTPKDIKDQVCFIGLMALGQNRFNEIIEELRADDVLRKPEYYSRSKREMRELAEKMTASDSNPLIEELDKKVSRVKRYCR